jgi:hypothetical protein
MRRKSLYGVAVVASIFWFLWALSPVIFPLLGWEWAPARVGQWGDAFGGFNALFSALAFVAVLFTLHQQQNQIDEAAQDQHLQRFERTFYELLRLLREAREDVEFRYTDGYDGGDRIKENNYDDIVTGPEAFKRAQFELRYWVEVEELHAGTVSSSRLAEIYITKCHNRYESTLAPYYRLLYTILSRIKNDLKLDREEKHRYGNLLRSQLTSHEVALCCYNGLSAVSGSFKELLVEFRIAKYLPEEFGRPILQDHYPPSTFLGRDVTPGTKPIATKGQISDDR